MKIYLCVDYDGMPAVNTFDEVDRGKSGYEKFSRIANDYVVAACEGAFAGGAKEIWISDAHEYGLNIDPERMPAGVKLIRGEMGDIQCMLPLLDKDFDGVAFLGMHSEAGSGNSPLSHTLDFKIASIKVNDVTFDEFDIHYNLAAFLGVRTIFVAGDLGLVAKIPEIPTVTLSHGIGGATIMNKTINEYKAEIKKVMESAVKNAERFVKPNRQDLRKETTLQIEYKNHKHAYRAEFYPNAKKINDTTVEVVCENYYEVMRALLFLG